jgi:hypothetical protein
MFSAAACFYTAVVMAHVMTFDLLSMPVLIVCLFGVIFWALTGMIHLMIVFVG